jgi:hypothetical protein
LKERSADQTVVSISLPRDLLEKIDARAESLHMPRSRYLALLAKTDIDRGGAMVIDPGPDAGMMDLVREVTDFLEMAVPALADYQRQQDDPAATPSFEPPQSAEENLFWNDFLDERDEILTLKWIESEKGGRDIGFKEAIQRWLQHRPEWRAAQSQRAG